MMTILDLRIKYRFDTGISPTYGKYDTSIKGNQPGANYRGGLTDEYAEWLESHFKTDIRLVYQKETCEIPVYYKKGRWPRYRKDYKEWLEERLLRYENISLFCLKLPK